MSTAPFGFGDPREVVASLAVGTSRRALAVPDWLDRGDARRSLLGYVAALAARSGLGIVRAPDAWADGAEAADLPAERWPEPEARRLLRALCADGRCGGGELAQLVRRCVGDALRARGCSIHPFDRFALRPLLGEMDADRVGSVDVGEWGQLAPKEREAAIRGLRRQDPAAARALVAAEFAGQPAAQRVAWLRALSPELSVDDQGLLESMLEDRAASVVAIATSLLARLPGTSQGEERLIGATQRLKARRTGLLRRGTVIEVDIAAPDTGGMRDSILRTQFAGVQVRRLAAAFALDEVEFAAALRDPALRRILYASAVSAGEVTAARALAVHLSSDDLSALRDELRAVENDFGTFGPTQRELLAATLPPLGAMREPLVLAGHAGWIYAVLRRPLVEAHAARLLDDAPSWTLWFQAPDHGSGAHGALLGCLALLPAPVRERAAEVRAHLPGPERREIEDFLNLMQWIERWGSERRD